MARTAEMRMIELAVLKNDIDFVIEYLGKKENFQLINLSDKNGFTENTAEMNAQNSVLTELKKICSDFSIKIEKSSLQNVELPAEKDFKESENIICEYNQLVEKIKLSDDKFASEQKNDDELVQVLSERNTFKETYQNRIVELIKSFSLLSQIKNVEKSLETTEMTYRITGWVSKNDVKTLSDELIELTDNKIAIREFSTAEVPLALCSDDSIPVKFNHGKVVKSFERMIFSYGSPVYGSVDPTPFVAVFFTLLFGVMFGDLGQAFVFLLIGILMNRKVIKAGGWNKFSPIFILIGISSGIMGLLTGEFFSNETLLEPFALWVTGLFGNPHAPILSIMPTSDPDSLKVMLGVFGAAVGVGFVINSIGLIINLINNIKQKKFADVLFGKNGLSGMIFFWYLVYFAIKLLLLKQSVQVYDFVVLGVSLFFSAFASPIERKMNGEEKIFENGFGIYIISSLVEIIEVFSGVLSYTISFVRVGAFALSHAVLDFTILSLTQMAGGEASIGGILILIVGNAVIVLLEGMIVAIQVIRLQYYEFFSKFFNKMGKEFKPLSFVIEI